MALPKGVSGNPRGRPPGVRNKLARENAERAAMTGLLPHEILLSFARGEVQIQKSKNPVTGEITEHEVFPDVEFRAQCANWCAPYFAPKLAQVQHKGIQKSADQVSDDELLRIATDIEPIDGRTIDADSEG